MHNNSQTYQIVDVGANSRCFGDAGLPVSVRSGCRGGEIIPLVVNMECKMRYFLTVYDIGFGIRFWIPGYPQAVTDCHFVWTTPIGYEWSEVI